MPYITFFLDLDLKTFIYRKQLQNKSVDRLETSGQSFYNRIRKGYFKIAESNPNRIKVIDANQSIEKINIEIREFVARKLDLKI
jgi:dTMP kinase